MLTDHSRTRDRTLILRVLVPSLEVRLRDKMKDAEDLAASRASSSSHHRNSTSTTTATGAAVHNNKEAQQQQQLLMDLEGVTCEPSSIMDGGSNTLWNFRCDGASYPARLVNLPCPVELHKTHDHCMYYKCVDVAQMLVVYEDQMALEEAEAAYYNNKSDELLLSFPSYYPHGVTPPLRRVVERRFAKREHDGLSSPPPPRAEVATVEYEMQRTMERIANRKPAKNISGNNGGGRRAAPANRQPAQPTSSTKVIEDIIVEDVVDYEPWMDDYGKQPQGIEIDDQDPLCTKHPELWLDPEEVAKITLADQTDDKTAPKKKKKKKKPLVEEEAAAAAEQSTKKGIASKKSMEEVDEIAQAAALMNQNVDNEDLGDDFEALFNFDGSDDPLAGIDF